MQVYTTIVYMYESIINEYPYVCLQNTGRDVIASK